METSDPRFDLVDLYMAAPDTVYMAMLTSIYGVPFRRHGCSNHCYHANGFDVHVKPYCRKGRKRGYF